MAVPQYFVAHFGVGETIPMSGMTFLELAQRVLKEENRPLSPSEIWKLAQAKGHQNQLRKAQGKTPAATLYSAIFSDEKQNTASQFIKIGARPARYFLKELAQTQSRTKLEKAAASDVHVPGVPNFKEYQLHPFLAYFASRKFSAYCRTIRHTTSRRKEFGQWVHPDAVAVHYPEDWKNEVRELCQATGGKHVMLYSFEIKKSLSFANLREAFFQAVSNSSWAHEGHLAAEDVSEDEDFLDELRRLSSSFGIGVIQLDIDDPDASRVIAPARRRDVLDWDALNKVAINKDVQELLTRVRNDIQTKEIRKEWYDPVLDPDQLVRTITQKKYAKSRR